MAFIHNYGADRHRWVAISDRRRLPVCVRYIYIETHLGGGAIMQRKPPALRNIGIGVAARALQRLRCDYPVEKVHGCAHRYLAEYSFTGRELLYCYPPYMYPPAPRGGATVATTRGRTTSSCWRCLRRCPAWSSSPATPGPT